MDLMGNMRRTHYSTRVTKDMVGSEVVVAGYVAKSRDLGAVIFCDVRDTMGIIQLNFNNFYFRLLKHHFIFLPKHFVYMNT